MAIPTFLHLNLSSQGGEVIHGVHVCVLSVCLCVVPSMGFQQEKNQKTPLKMA